jgi:hypothetical protein
MFDTAKTITLKGTVKEYEWTNPHSWLRVDGAGSRQRQTATMGVRNEFARRQATLGMTPETGEARRCGHRDVSSAQGRFARRTIHPGYSANGKAAVRGERGAAPAD